MRLNEFLTNGGVIACPVDEFAGHMVHVGLPGDWEPFESATGMRLWVCRSDLRSSMFCSNAVLTMHRIEAPLLVYEVFGMLAEQQLQSVSGGREVRRESFDATEGPGMTGLLVMQIDHELGSISSVSQTRPHLVSPHDFDCAADGDSPG